MAQITSRKSSVNLTFTQTNKQTNKQTTSKCKNYTNLVFGPLAQPVSVVVFKFCKSPN